MATASQRTFLSIENSLSNVFIKEWATIRREAEKEITRLVKDGRYADARDVAMKVSLGRKIAANKAAIRTFGMAAVLFGAQKLRRNATQTSHSNTDSVPIQVEQGADTLAAILAQPFDDAVQTGIIRLINQVEANVTDDETTTHVSLFEQLLPTKKQAFPQEVRPNNFSSALTSFMTDRGESFIHIGASLHTSRLSSWGLVNEANLLGVQAYRVNEVLDGRTCPVCREMHGKIFPVSPALKRLGEHLAVGQDAEALRSIAPWPRQDRANVAALKQMSTEELIAKGWDTPPYHPLCRGTLDRASKRQAATLPPALRPTPAAENREALLEVLGALAPFVEFDDEGNVVE